jgi:DNA-binding XRE family transcriptional regulator
MESKEFSQIRHYLGKSQSQLALFLCISHKTVQSFEQGFRKIPTYIERQMLLFLALKKMSSDAVIMPCWEIKNCPNEWRESCIVWELKARHFCWFINGTYCQGQFHESWKKKHEVCLECEVYQSMIPQPAS